ncbi:hypothetical protein ALC53_10839 [Atta colombica]|uniref:Uncharacterized protein n=1 Tax=Atta colombica TaxID=520822 RepID=A0A195B3D9_9HYME|nr:hypothetical protein ALC53_10839 [Atta colombica]
MGISGYLEEVRTDETRADMNGHVKTNVLSALQAKVIPTLVLIVRREVIQSLPASFWFGAST